MPVQSADNRRHGILLDHAEHHRRICPGPTPARWIARSRPLLREPPPCRASRSSPRRASVNARRRSQLLERFLLLRPLRFDRFALRARRSELGVELLEAVVHAILLILLALHDLPLDLEQLDPAPSIFDLRRSRMLGDRDARARGIEQAHRLVGKLARRHIALRQRDRSRHGLVQNDDVMMLLP